MNGNVRPDMLRQAGAQQGMLAVSPPFMQGMPSSGQQQLAPNHLGMASNANATNPALMLNNSAASMNPQQRYQALQQQAANDLRPRQMQQMRQAVSNQHMMGPAGSSMSAAGGAPPHMAALAHNQGMSFNANMMAQQSANNAVRRVSSQSSLTQGPGPLTGMSPGVVNPGLGMGMNPPTNMNSQQMRQLPPQIQQMRMQQSQQQHLQNQMGPEMAMAMNRPIGNPGMPPGRTPGSAQAQLMNSLPQQASISHPMGLHQNQFQNPMQIPSQHQPPQMSSPRVGSHTPNMSLPTPGPSQAPVGRPQMNPEDNSMNFMNFSNPQFGSNPNPSRMSQSNGQFPPFVPPSGSPIPITDNSQQMPSGLSGASGSNPNRPGFHLTPAQQFEQMNASPENFSSHFSMPPPSHVPPRPPSHNHNSPHPTAHPQQHSIRQSPHPPDPHSMTPQRPQSQPQAIPRPPSQQQARTPRAAPSQLSPGIVPPPSSANRMGMQVHPPPQPGQQILGPGPGPGQPLTAIGARPPPGTSQQLPPTAGSSTAVSAAPLTEGPSDAQPPGPVVSRPMNAGPSLGNGQGLIRLLQFSGVLAAENHQKLQLSYWNDTISEYFTPRANTRFTFWKDSQRHEAKQFDIGLPILPRFFLVTTQSGVKSMTLSLDGARERMYSPGHSIVECVGAIWTYKYTNGYTVVLRGPLTAHVVITSPYPTGSNSHSSGPPSPLVLRFDDFQFDANSHEKYIALDVIAEARIPVSPKMRVRGTPTPTPNGSASQKPPSSGQGQFEEDKRWEEPRITIDMASIPGEPVNAFGIPQATMRCLELAESVAQMGELIAFSTETSLGPLEALKKYAARIKEMHAISPLPPLPLPNPIPNGVHASPGHHPMNPFNPMHGNSNVPSTPSVTLYSSAPPSVTNPPGNVPSTSHSQLNSPKNAPASASNSPQKQHKQIPPPLQSQQQQQATPSSSSAVVTSPTVSSGATTNTPSLSNASLKRKQGTEAASPTTSTNEPPQKRQTRKRRTTNAG